MLYPIVFPYGFWGSPHPSHQPPRPSEAIPSHGSCGAFDEELIEVECPAGAVFPETLQNLNALDRCLGSIESW